ncbi:hypothetical protein Leryth_009071 [Lithospermum erythrorhizon]|nr:hypothetical protein Leryth_009071 [Lithospermum erythrorhizon]
MDKNYHGGETRAPPSAAAEEASELVLQWGNRKRPRCMKKVDNKPGRNNNNNKSGSDSPVQRVSSRVNSSRINSNNNNNINRSSICEEGINKNGYINLRQRPSASPPHRILRNSDSSVAMRAQSNGVRGLASPERGGGAHDRRANNHHLSNGNNHQANNNSSRCNKNSINDNNHSSRGGRSPSSETGNDGKNGGSTSASGMIVASWPPKFEIALTNKEKEEDFLVLKGSKLPQRPKKRSKIIQRTVNLISPGAWLCDLSLERYEVREKKVTKKRPRGLKAMGNNVESDSE